MLLTIAIVLAVLWLLGRGRVPRYGGFYTPAYCGSISSVYLGRCNPKQN
jgi:hypothetical protein